MIYGDILALKVTRTPPLKWSHEGNDGYWGIGQLASNGYFCYIHIWTEAFSSMSCYIQITDPNPRSTGRGSVFLTPILLLPISPTDGQSASGVPKAPGAFFLQREKHWVYLCAQGNGQPSFTPRRMHTNTVEKVCPRTTLPSPSPSNPSPAAPPAQSCCCISLLTYKAPSSPILSLPQAETIHHAVGLWHTQMGEGSQISLSHRRDGERVLV